MPHVIVFTHFENLAKGPTFVANDDILLLDYLGATLSQDSREGQTVNESPTAVLDKLEKRGYRVVAMSANATETLNTYVWTLHKPEEIEPFA